MIRFSFELAFAALLAATSVAGIVFAARGSRDPARGSGGSARGPGDSARDSRGSARRHGSVAIAVVLVCWLASVLFMTLRARSGSGALLNLVPLRFGGPGAVIDAVLNVGVFIPLGLLLGAAGIRFSVALLTGLLLSAGIELSQYLAQVGRTADINDVITNTTGTVLGWVVCAAIVHIRRRVDG